MLKEAERIFDEFAKTLEKQVVSSPTENFIVDWKSKFKEFVSLVMKMREAQINYFIIDLSYEYAKGHRCADRELVLQRAEAMTKAIKLEDEVDEYLKKMEE